MDLGPAEDRFAPFDALVRLARDRGLGLYLRVTLAMQGIASLIPA